jgi:hypothetical protein
MEKLAVLSLNLAVLLLELAVFLARIIKKQKNAGLHWINEALH